MTSSTESVYYTQGEKITPFLTFPDQIQNYQLVTKSKLNFASREIIWLYISYSTQKLQREILQALFIFVFLVIFSLLVFIAYIKQTNKLIIQPIQSFIGDIDRYKAGHQIEPKKVDGSFLEIAQLSHNFHEFIREIDSAQDDLATWNIELESRIERKTAELSMALDKAHRFQSTIIALEKLASLGMLSAGIAHEIKNPLNIILNASEALKNLDPTDKENSKRLCELISSSVLRADKIIKAMLSQARSETSQISKQNISHVCDQALELATHSKKCTFELSNLKIHKDIEPEIFLNCYVEDIQRIIINLVDNSIDALIEKSKTTDNFFPEIILELGRDENNIYIKIQDNVRNPRPLNRNKKEPFFSTKPTGKGTGLGMSMINDIIIAQGGDLHIESIEEKYTECFIQLPTNTEDQDVA